MLADLLDQRTPFGRLSLVQVFMTAGDTLLTVSLAGSLFFSISPKAAESKVLLYLVLTMAPFAVVAPFLGPVIDRSRGIRRLVVVASAASRAAVCLVMAGKLHSLLLFPLAFVMLVLSKVYLVTKGSIVPLYAATATGGADPAAGREAMATLNARLGLLASLAGFAASLPAIAVLKLLGGSWVLRLDILVFAAGTIAGLRLPMLRGEGQDSPRPSPAGADESEAWAPSGPLAALGGRFATHAEVMLARSAMSVLKGTNGFLTFLLAFGLRRANAATWWYGLALGASVAGAVVGVLAVPRARRHLSEPAVLGLALWLAAGGAVLAATLGGLLAQSAMAFLIGLAGAAGKPSFDALVQRYVPTAGQGRAFARFETQFQLVWVVGAIVPVVVPMQLVAGDVVIGVVAVVAALSYLTGRRAVRPARRGPDIG